MGPVWLRQKLLQGRGDATARDVESVTVTVCRNPGDESKKEFRGEYTGGDEARTAFQRRLCFWSLGWAPTGWIGAFYDEACACTPEVHFTAVNLTSFSFSTIEVS